MLSTQQNTASPTGLLRSKALGRDVHDDRRINGLHGLAGGRHFELANVCGEKSLCRNIAGFDPVKVDQLQPPHADRGQLQRNLPANGAHADHGGCQAFQPVLGNKILLAFKSIDRVQTNPPRRWLCRTSCQTVRTSRPDAGLRCQNRHSALWNCRTPPAARMWHIPDSRPGTLPGENSGRSRRLSESQTRRRMAHETASGNNAGRRRPE